MFFFHHWSICCFVWDVRWLLDYWMIFFCTVSFALWLHELTACPTLWYHDGNFHYHCLEAGECWCPSLIWIWSHTDWLSGSANLEKEKSYQQQKVLFSHLQVIHVFHIVLRTIYNRIPRGWDAHKELICHFIDLYVFLQFVGLFKTE